MTLFTAVLLVLSTTASLVRASTLPDVSLGDWVRLKEIAYSASDKTASATLIVKPNGDSGGALTVSLAGSYSSSSISGTAIEFSGSTLSDWEIPGKVAGLNLNSTAVKLTYTRNVLGVASVTGSLKASAHYNQASFGLETALPPTDGSKGILLAAWVAEDDTLDLGLITGEADYPNVTCLKAGLIFSPEHTTFSFPDDSPFLGASYEVVNGLNAVIKVDITQGEVSSLASLGVGKNFYATGSIGDDGNFSLSAALDDVAVSIC